MSDNEHTLASLGQAEVLSVENSVGEPIPELAQRPEDGTKVPSAVGGQDAGDVFPDDPPGAKNINQRHEGQRKVASMVGKPAS